MSKVERHDEMYDYIIVGSGAGGASLASRLVRAGKKVLVIEAGPDHTTRGPRDPGNEISRVPLLHAASSEHPDLSWRFFVDHYERDGAGRLPDRILEDPKRYPSPKPNEDGKIFYPRSAGIGGCTIHNAMITIAGPESDWDELATYLDDPSWNGRRMRGYFQRLEHNDYLPAPTLARRSLYVQIWKYGWSSIKYLFGFTPDTTRGRHGFDGWLHTSFTDLSIGLQDKQLVKTIKAALKASKRAGLDNAWSLVSTFLKGRVWQSLDPNHAETQSSSPEGIVLIPLCVHGKGTTIHQNRETPYAMLGRRCSPREFLLETLALHRDKLSIWTDCLVTKVILDGAPNPKAVGVELLKGASLYRAHVTPSIDAGVPMEVRVREGGEVILCGGSFNTPQLLMLSGIGDPDELKREGIEIECNVVSRGVGKNLQDRYEVSLVSQFQKDFSFIDGATFKLPTSPDEPDRHLKQWREEGTGLYTSNGGVVGIFKRSRPELLNPDLFIFGIPSEFRGYQVGYSEIKQHNLFTWVILKSHTRNREGYVRLRSTDPKDTPKINFQYFGTGVEGRPFDSADDPDVKSLMHGVGFVREILEGVKSIAKETYPASEADSDGKINEWIRRVAWGHHACGTCRMGPEGDANAVLDSHFRVRGVSNLRVVDASIFPKIPGYFIVTNIYMASEKAADVILEEAGSNNVYYPNALQNAEADEIKVRRENTEFVPLATALHSKGSDQSDACDAKKSVIAPTVFEPPLDDAKQWSDDVTGLALSGGGIRSATQALGIMQSMARKQLLRRFDFLSTVSGGGYIGSFLGRCYDQLRSKPDGGELRSAPPADLVEQTLVDPDSPAIQWLRSHGNYIAPNGPGDGRTNFAVFIRNFLSLHLVVGLFIFAFFGIANAIRYGFFDRLWSSTGLLIDRSQLPIGHLIESSFGPWFSPWFILVELLLLFLVLPRIVGYWIVSQDKHECFKLVPFAMMFVTAGLFLWIGVKDSLKFDLVFIGLGLLSSLIHVELAWWRGRQFEAASGTGSVETQRLRTRNYLTYDLGLALGLTGIALAFSLIDSMGHGLQEWKLQMSFTYTRAFAALGAAIMTIVPLMRWLASFFQDSDASGPPSTLKRILKGEMTAGLLAIVFFTLPLVAYSFASHAVYQGGNTLWIGIVVTLGAVAATAAFALPSALTFVNRSSISETYSARLARAYLGASNPARRRPEGMNVTEVVAGDDVASIRDYQPQKASGPFHLINVTLNQTIDSGSRLRKRDRQGMNMAVSCLGVTVGETWHSKWADASNAGLTEAKKIPTGLDPIDRKPGEFHPLVDMLDRPTDRAEMLSLRQWIGISGAAADPGLGRMTKLGIALLMGMLNIRTGHWWDSGISAADRAGWPKLSPIRRILYLIPRYFATQSLLLFEWIARYPGPWERFWHISDGGYFENLATYELIRRRVPRIVICDGGADPSYRFDDFGELVRKARIDFNARIESLTTLEINSLAEKGVISPAVHAQIGTVGDLKPPTDANGKVTGFSPKHASLCWVHYPTIAATKCSLILFIKSSVTGDETNDVLNYQVNHPEFPHESTGDQIFDEAQWESYRKLGEHIGTNLFDDDWFWRVPLPLSKQGAV